MTPAERHTYFHPERINAVFRHAKQLRQELAAEERLLLEELTVINAGLARVRAELADLQEGK